MYLACIRILFTECATSLTLARACAAKGYCSRLVGRSVGWLICWFVSPHVFSLTVATVDVKRGYVGMCNGRSAQQESGVKVIYSYYNCVH